LGFFDYAVGIIAVIAVIAAAYYATWWIAKRANGGTIGSGRNIRVIERFSFSKEKLLCLVEVNGKTYLIAYTNGGVSLIDSYDEPIEAAESAAARPDFVAAMRDAWNKRKEGK
jgi:flagellar biogenesis protein FliO